jgi:DNA invertase Pin-like site-specific DNA recombinase
MTIYGYARVSTDGQSLASQESELKAAGCAKVFAEKVSGARGDRAELAKALKRLESGDTLIVTRLDRLARSTRDLLNILHTLSQNGVSFRSLHDAWADTTSAHGRLMLTVLGGLAEFERELILARTNDGRKRAKARGVRFGRPHKLTAHQRQEALARLANGETQADIARSYAASIRRPSAGWLKLRRNEAPLSSTTSARMFLQGLQDLGYVEGRDLQITYRSSDGYYDRRALTSPR